MTEASITSLMARMHNITSGSRDNETATISASTSIGAYLKRPIC